jgi:hypothetical protein
LNNAFGKFHRFVNFAIHKERQEGAVEQLAIVRIALESRTLISCGGAGVPLLAGMTSSQVTARRCRVAQFEDA